MRSVRPVGLFLSLTLAALLVLAACGGSSSNSTTTSGATTAATSAATSAAGAATTVASPAATKASSGAASPAATSAAAGSPASGSFSGTFDGTILFGAAISLTGATSKEGGYTRDGYELWKDTYNANGGIVINGKHYKIETEYYDDTSNAQTAATLADKLIKEDHVQFLLGPYGTSSTLQVSTVAEKNQIPMVDTNGAAKSIFSQGYQYTFGVLSPAPNYLQGVIDMALAQNPKPKSVAILSADDPFSVEVADAAQKYAQSKGLEVVYYQKYPNASTNLTAPLTEAKGKNPDLLLNSGHLEESVAIMQQAHQLDLNPLGYGFSVGPSLPDFQSTLKNDANYVFGGTQWTPQLTYNADDLFKSPANYAKLFQQRFGAEPPYQAAESTAGGVTFVKAIEKAGSVDPKKVRDALAGLSFTSFYGPIKFDAQGMNVTKPMAVEQWQNGQKQTVWPQDVAAAKPMWPTPHWNQR
ncbi:MAG TPA: amino acid ABC transporter substrate-binding protein [Nitrolancea sp.]|nr:amino acid ABC transporter substrate-binding protein [Nitrolancea sp.]